MYNATVATIDAVEPIEGKDRIVKSQVCWSRVITQVGTQVGDLVLYFPVDWCVTEEYGTKNGLFKSLGGYLEANGRIRCLKMAWVKSDGLVMPLSSLNYAFNKWHVFTKWDIINEIDWHQICYKYINPATLKAQQQQWSWRKLRWSTAMFPKHIDTEQLLLYTKNLNEWDNLIITAKVHGTSQRVWNVQEEVSWVFGRIARFFGRPLKEWRYLVGTRNTIVTDQKPDGWYSNDFRFNAAKPFADKLHKNEVVFYEVVGRENWHTPLMWSISIKEFDQEKQDAYANNTGIKMNQWLIYTYGCEPGEQKIFVYRIAMVNEDWHIVDYTWDQVKKRCLEMQVDHVPELERIIYDGDPQKLTDYIIGRYENVDDVIDPTHPLEGICVRVDNWFIPDIYKWKTRNFKLWEGIVKSQSDYVDMEESS